MSLKLVMFDMDGVLIDACDWHKEAFNKALGQYTDYVITEEEHYSTFNGLPTKVKLKKLTDMGVLLEEYHKDIGELKQQKTLDIIHSKCQYDETKVELIKWLKENNVKVACFTNSIRKTACLMLEKAGVFSSLDMFVSNQDVVKSKPDPEGYLKILKDLGINPDDAMIVEDSPKGIQAARASGCKVMQVNNATEVNIENVRRFINESFNTNGG